MSQIPSELAASTPAASENRGKPVAMWASIALSAVALIWFFSFVPRFGMDRQTSALGWLLSAWNGETDYEHGLLFPVVIAGLIFYRLKDLKAAVTQGSFWGLAAILIGALLFVVSYRTFQPRIAVAGLPFLLWGSALYLWGWQVGRMLLFPLFFFWLAVPLPTFQQATTHLQLLATSMAHHGSGLFGVQTYTQGTMVLPVTGDWMPLSIAHGCSGIRSLMALLMISAAWAYVAKMAMWKKVLVFLAAFPLAILGNALRVISIFVIAEYGDAEWASTTWHDWSGLLLFYPFSLLLLLVIHSILEGGLPWKRSGRRKLTRVVVRQSKPPETTPAES
jgi:exosortase